MDVPEQETSLFDQAAQEFLQPEAEPFVERFDTAGDINAWSPLLCRLGAAQALSS